MIGMKILKRKALTVNGKHYTLIMNSLEVPQISKPKVPDLQALSSRKIENFNNSAFSPILNFKIKLRPDDFIPLQIPGSERPRRGNPGCLTWRHFHGQWQPPGWNPGFRMLLKVR